MTQKRFCEKVDLMNKAAQALGRLGKGVKKRLSEAEIKRRSERLKEARTKRWTHKNNGKM